MSINIISFILTEFPDITDIIPLAYFEAASGKYLSTIDTNPEKYAFRNGWHLLHDDILPDPFYACGIKNAGTSEYLYVAIKKGTRIFWFYCQLFSIFNKEGPNKSAKCKLQLKEAICKWKKGANSVIFALDVFL